MRAATAVPTPPTVLGTLSMLGTSLVLLACSGRYPQSATPPTELTALPGLPALPPGCLVANHVHTIVSDRYSHAPVPANERWAYSASGLRAAIAGFAGDGVDAIVLADHNSIAAAFDPQIASAPLTVIPGMEWTTRSGHALLIDPRVDLPATELLPPPWRTRPRTADFRAMVDRTHARGGIVVIAHPRVPFRTWPDDTFGADGVEVWGLRSFVMRNPAALRWWHDRLVRGERLIAVAGTDLHPGARVRRHREPLNRVHAARCDAPTVLAAVRAGHLALVRDRHAPTLLLGVETGGDLDFADAQAGDLVPATATLDLQIRVLRGGTVGRAGGGRAGLLPARTLDPANPAVRLRLRPRPGDFVRAELRRGRALLAVSNPVYVED